MTLTQVTDRLNDSAALTSGGGDVARGGVLENNLTASKLNLSG